MCLTQKIHGYDPLFHSEKITGMGGPNDRGKGIEEVDLASSDSLDECFCFVTYMMFGTLDSMLSKNQM